MNEREQFEAWMSDGGTWPKAVERDGNGQYALAMAAAAWQVWQARAALAASTVPAPAQQAERECRHCGWLCRPNPAESQRWYPLTDPAPAPAVEAQADMSSAARDVLAERSRQIEVEGWTPEHDDEHDDGNIASAASAYALAAADVLHPFSQGDGDYKTAPPGMWPWIHQWWKPGTPRRMLVKAGALILAEIERLDRAALKESQR
nr:hypothetical protein [uncultured Roseateles sp.]